MTLTKTNLGLTGGFIVTGSDLVANVIYEAINCKEYPTLPRKADIIVDKTTELYKREFEKTSDSFYFRNFETRAALVEWLNTHITSIPEIQELNLSQKEYDAKITVDDPNRVKYVFTCRYSPSGRTEDDFIDLDAFVGNLANNLIRENVSIHYGTI